jgi:TRAP-type C4-dicarboxylate transport system permease large subunit
LTNSVLSITDNRILLLILINILLLMMGCLMDGISIMIITLPLLLGITDLIGVDRVHFGVIMTLNTIMGMITPPFGINLFVIASITDAPMKEIIQAIIPFYIPLLISLFIITFVPEIVLWLPNLLGL